MYRIKAIEAPLDEDLGDFSLYLQQQGVPNRVYEESGTQVLWVIDEAHVEPVRRAYALFQRGDLRLKREKIRRPQGESLGAKLARAPRYWVTLTLVLLSFIGFLLPYIDSIGLVGWLTFQKYELVRGKIVFANAADSFSQGEYWRLLSPIFLHFGPLHFIFNSLWLWELGRRVELLQGHLRLLAVVALVGIGSNIFQFVYQAETLFGGMSGVIYGLLGYCWIWDKVYGRPCFSLAPGIIGFMLFWLVFCMSGALDMVGIGVANAAHFSGLVIGMLMGAWGAWVARP